MAPLDPLDVTIAFLTLLTATLVQTLLSLWQLSEYHVCTFQKADNCQRQDGLMNNLPRNYDMNCSPCSNTALVDNSHYKTFRVVVVSPTTAVP
jgi:hypothetical protein